MEKTSGNRWLVAVGTIIAQIGLGTIYTWSLFNQPLANKFETNISDVSITFSIMSLALAVAAMFGDALEKKLGIRKLTTIAAVLLSVGLIGTAFAPTLSLVYVLAGVLVGAADGVAYLTCLSNCIKWFPDKKGVIAGLCVGAYGIGSLLFKTVYGLFLANLNVSMAFLCWGILTLVMIGLGAQLLKDAPVVAHAVIQEAAGAREYSIKEMLCTKEAYMLFVILFTACMGGLYLIGIVKDLSQQVAGMSIADAANVVALVALFNTAGRLVLGSLSDHIGRLTVLLITMALTTACVFTLGFIPTNGIFFIACVGLVAFCFGGNLTVFPAIVGEAFGVNRQTSNYGVIYLGFGFGAVSASAIAALTGSFIMPFKIIGALAIISFLFAAYMMSTTGHAKKQTVPFNPRAAHVADSAK